MSKDLESRMRDALRPVAPSEDTTQKLMAIIAVQPPTPILRPLAPPRIAQPRSAGRQVKRPAWWISLGMAASLLIAVGVQHRLQESRERERGLEARREVVEALHVTSQKLDLAYEMIRSQSTAPAGENSGV
jgi:hypothetical protein